MCHSEQGSIQRNFHSRRSRPEWLYRVFQAGDGGSPSPTETKSGSHCLLPSRLDSKILQALEKWVSNPELAKTEVDRNIRCTAGMLYAQGGGEDNTILKNVALYIREDHYQGAEPSPQSSGEYYKVLKEIEHKVNHHAQSCVTELMNELL